MADKILKELTLKIWRQKDAKSKGEFKTYKVHNISTGSSFLEMLDILNEELVAKNEEPVAFDHDCREGICGTCSLFVDGRAHGPDDDVTTCQLHMRRFEDGATITIEPWRCGAFPVIKDLIVDRKAYDKILQAGGYVSVNTGGVPDGNAIPIPNAQAEEAMDAAACIGCGKCAKECPFEAITVENNLAYIDFNKCRLCRKCVSACPTGAIHEVNFPPRKIETDAVKTNNESI